LENIPKLGLAHHFQMGHERNCNREFLSQKKKKHEIGGEKKKIGYERGKTSSGRKPRTLPSYW